MRDEKEAVTAVQRTPRAPAASGASPRQRRLEVWAQLLFDLSAAIGLADAKSTALLHTIVNDEAATTA